MSDQKLSTEVAAILSGDRALIDKLLESPSAMLIPFMKSRESFFLLVSLAFDNSDQVVDEVGRLCLSAIKLLIQSGIADELPGIEVVPYVKSSNKMHRLFRLSVLRDGFDAALRLQEKDLANESPAEGVTCGWYIEKPSA